MSCSVPIPRLVSNFALAMLSAVLLVLCQSPFDFFPLGTFALVPWLIATRRSGPVGAFMIGLAMGVVYAISGADWLFAAFDSQGAHGIRAVLGALATALWAKGLLFGGAGWITQRLSSRSPALQLLFGALFIGAAELWISTSPWGLPLLLLGHSQHSAPGVAQLAVVIGVAGISAFLFALNAAIASVFIDGRTGQRRAAGWAAAWLSVALGGLPLAQSFEPAMGSQSRTLLIVQPDIPRSRRWDPAYQGMILEEIAAATSHALEESDIRPDAIVWPENVLTSPGVANNDLGRELQAHVDRWRVPVVTGLVRRARSKEPGRYRSSVVWWSPVSGQRDALDKVRAVPLIESSRPFWGRGAMTRIVGGAAKGPRVVEALAARPLRGDFSLATALCFEVLFPGVVADQRSPESVAIVNLADDSWVPGEIVDAQLIAAAAFRAIEQRLTLVRVSHGGLSVVIDRFGREIVSLEPDAVGHLFVEVAAAPPPPISEKAAILLLPVIAGLLTCRLWSALIRHFATARHGELRVHAFRSWLFCRLGRRFDPHRDRSS
jgi:apolipoprotein N-acyltransferase